ncbi:MAG: NAD-dependent epimerase/dehydratase family protein [Actinobacteria bacterium]|nr:NAD-dependent epimerase/dehydratase family protein [Actinomycetota bacterium]MBE3128441.1 NAD-dependent epimerase/dehydratase family protein [Actinomycetota bacterium]
MKKILITGGAGFIGYHLSKILSEDTKNEVNIIDDFSQGKNDEFFKELIKKDNVNFYKMDLTDLDTYSKIDTEYDQIYHLAAIVGVRRVEENPDLTLRVNALSTIYLLEYIKKMRNKPKLLFSSSCENYAGSIKVCNVKVPTPENVPLCIEDINNPRWSYAVSKILGECACINYSKKFGFGSVVVRYHNIYGPRMGTHHVIPELIFRIIKRKNPFPIYGGKQYRTFCYIDDAVKMTINVMNNSKDNLYNIGSDSNEILIEDIAKMLFKISNYHPEIIEKGAPEGSINRRKADLLKMKSEGLMVNEVNFKDGLEKTHHWYKKYFEDDTT